MFLKPFDDLDLTTRITRLMRSNNGSAGNTIHKSIPDSSIIEPSSDEPAPLQQLSEATTDPSVNIKDMIQMEIKKAQKGKYVFELFMLLIYKPTDQMSSSLDEEYSLYLNSVYPEIEKPVLGN